jgi:2-amino-4-hydroxy-6-hydroxymethyldihydropteridine diphosphokinase
MQNRRFALLPLAELAPDVMHPVLNKTIAELLKECPDKLPVKKITD